MCGICGYVGPAEEPIDAAAGRAMRDVLVHRGPDGLGDCVISGSAQGKTLHGWLGHTRLKILDLTDAAEQPMANEDRSVVLTYNGEVYNFRELRAELETHGHRFRSSGDTEVVLRAYEQWGDDCLGRLDGMFALALWDAREARLVLARDRTGKKPLFYALAGRRLLFGSEIKALLASPWVEARLDASRLPEFLTYGYVPHPATLYEGIRQVPPASLVSFDARGLSEPIAYWDPLPSAQTLRPGPEVARRLRELLSEATSRRMIADVPLGALLSGGIDSSIVVGLMAERAPEVHTFSIGFPEEPSFDEREHARAVADHFGTRHTEFAVKIDAVALIDRLLWHHDQPYADSSAIPTYIVSRLAREHVTVVLNGDGGDEVFGGYDRFVAASMSMRLPRSVARAARRGVGFLPRSQSYYSPQRRAERFLELADSPVQDRYQSWIAVANRDLLVELLAPTLRPLASDEGVERSMRLQYERAQGLPMLDQILFANFATYLPDDLSVKMDRMSMANSLEARSPFLDTAVVEYVARLPARYKVGRRRLKPLLRDAFYPLLPPSIWKRRKHGFGVPMGSWFRGELGTVFQDEVLAADARSRELLDGGTVRRLWNEHSEHHREHGFRLWTLLNLERWLRSLEMPRRPAAPADRVVTDTATARA